MAAVEKAQGKAPQAVEDFRRVLDDKAIDAVFICTPHHWHAPIALRALQAGKHVYVEKPASHVYREGQLLVQAAKKYKKVVQHGTQMRSSEVTAKAREVLQSGLLGEIKMAKAWNVQRHSHRAPAADAPIAADSAPNSDSTIRYSQGCSAPVLTRSESPSTTCVCGEIG